jgi:hypothetical protein
MRKSVTATAALVLSPTELPEDPARLPDVFDAFARVVEGLEHNELAWRSKDWPLSVRHPGDPDHVFRATPLLPDGRTAPTYVPRACRGRVTRQVVAEYMTAGWALYPRAPSRGMRIPFTWIDYERHMTWSVVPARLPLIDPVRELMQEDDETVLPLTAGVTGDWAPVLTAWENLDGLMGLKTPGEAWLRRRMARTVAAYRGFWSIIEGFHDADDGARYEGMWGDPLVVTVYLGWPAYFISAAGEITSCPACSRVTIQGRRYCGTLDCNRARAAARQQTSRAASRQRRRAASV